MAFSSAALRPRTTWRLFTLWEREWEGHQTEDNLLVFYVPDADEWRRRASRLEELGHKPVKSLNPYWDRNGKKLEDPGGYRLVLQHSSWPSEPLPGDKPRQYQQVRDRGRYNFVPEVMHMSGYVHPTEQLVTEIVVRDIRRSVDFYERLGFTLLRDGGDFVELTWEDHRLYLAELSAYHLDPGTELPLPPAFPQANVRVMVPDVDQCWRRANDLGARVITAVDDRYYGLRDFIIADPDGFGIRFASRLQTP